MDRCLLTASADGGRHSVLTTIVDFDTRSVLFDPSPDEAMNNRLCSCREVLFVTSHSGVRIQFTTPPLRRVRLGQAGALRGAMPTEVLRLQRRASYRLVTPLANPVTCHITTEQGLIDATVVDLSVGGVGLLSHRRDLTLQVGRMYRDCRLNVPNLGQFTVNLIVRNSYETTLRNGRRTQRVGCQFIDLPSGLEAKLQRYIIEAERARRKRYI